MLPITRVVLFQHGVGYFERSGTVDGNETIELLFKTEQMNDLLKSLTTIDLDGGTFTVLNYESEDPFEKRLEDSSIQIPENGAVSAFLGQLKGAEVLVPRATGDVHGVIVGIEQIKRKEKDVISDEPQLAILVDKTRLLRIPLLEANEITFLDEVIVRDLNKLLGVHRSNLNKNRKKLTIHSTGEGKRRISISYVIEVPVWKTSYRMVLSEGDREKPFLQGWAMVDNTSEDDWNQVDLSLVSGLPVSFVHDLYSPRYRKRPEIAVEMEAEATPAMFKRGLRHYGEFEDADVEFEDYMEPMPEMESMSDSSIVNQKLAALPKHMKTASTIRESIEPQAKAREVGDLFSYDISRSVDINSGNSALVPILQTESESERILIYNPESREKNPMAAVHFQNSTGLTLEEGPVTVIDSGCYAGEAMLGYLRKNDDCIIPYAVELRVDVNKEHRVDQKDFHRVRKQGDYIHKFYQELLTTEYRISSELDREAVLYLDHPITHALDESAKIQPVEITENYWRYKIELAPHGKAELKVTEVAEQWESIRLGNIVKKEIHQLRDNKLISAAIRKELESIADKHSEVVKLKDEQTKKLKKLEKITDGQKRLRNNIKALGSTTEEADLRRKYVTKLSAEEEQIENLMAEFKELGNRFDAERENLSKMVDALKIK